MPPINAAEFLAVMEPELVRPDAARLARRVTLRWQPPQIRSLLQHDDSQVRAAAATALGLVGSMSDVPSLTGALQDADACVHAMAEHALWSIWFRSGSDASSAPFRAGIGFLAEENYGSAIDCFRKAHEADGNFAEAYNQCAIAHYFQAQWREALDDCRRTVELVPVHFGAILGMGHCFAQMGELGQALEAYRRALEVNPRMPAIAQVLKHLNARGASRLSGMLQ